MLCCKQLVPEQEKLLLYCFINRNALILQMNHCHFIFFYETKRQLMIILVKELLFCTHNIALSLLNVSLHLPESERILEQISRTQRRAA
jgi:hypothetical protein